MLGKPPQATSNLAAGLRNGGSQLERLWEQAHGCSFHTSMQGFAHCHTSRGRRLFSFPSEFVLSTLVIEHLDSNAGPEAAWSCGRCDCTRSRRTVSLPPNHRYGAVLCVCNSRYSPHGIKGGGRSLSFPSACLQLGESSAALLYRLGLPTRVQRNQLRTYGSLAFPLPHTA